MRPTCDFASNDSEFAAHNYRPNAAPGPTFADGNASQDATAGATPRPGNTNTNDLLDHRDFETFQHSDDNNGDLDSFGDPHEQDVWALLEPLPPGWKHGKDFTKGLHRSTDVFDDLSNDEGNHADNSDGWPKVEGYEDVNEPTTDEACDNGELTAPTLPSDRDRTNEGNNADIPHHLPKKESNEDLNEPTADRARDNGVLSEPAMPSDRDLGDSPVHGTFQSCFKRQRPENDRQVAPVPVPVGPPSRVSAAQRARLHELLQQRDAHGRAPFHLDDYDNDSGKWAAYRRAVKERYREHRKRKRAEGTWEKTSTGEGPLLRAVPRLGQTVHHFLVNEEPSICRYAVCGGQIYEKSFREVSAVRPRSTEATCLPWTGVATIRLTLLLERAWITAMAVANQLYHMARARKWEQCLSTLGTMRDRCASVDIVDFNICIHACRHHWEHALSCFRHARQQSLQPTVRTFGSLCAALGVGHRWVQVLALLQHVPCTWDNTDVLTNVVLGVFKKAHRWDLALELCAGWKIAKTVDSVGMMELVGACSKSFRWQEALALACSNKEPKLQVYNWLLYGFRGGACWQAGIALLDHAASRRVAANAISHRHLMFLLDGAPWQQAVQLLQDSCGWSQRWREVDAETIVLATAAMECQHRPVENLHIFGQIVYHKLHMHARNGSAAFTSKGAHDITILHDSWVKAGWTSLLEPAWCRHFLSPASVSLRMKRFVQPSAMCRLSHTTLENAHVVPGFVARLVTEVNSLRGASRWRTTWWMQAQLALRPLFAESRVLRRADAGTVRAWIGYVLMLPESAVSMRDELTFEAKPSGTSA
ncbi:Pentatricopeptide repeat-containing protein, chloroplastic [Symbiodinium microadriaticum]|uniref:Pentatricopeptide repeat-containing protein, chloroplastic n=1 Tax=Symbiodinium microadriaticum TaxID=2951 RepID=A0A1Q9CS08_SYMMI|nr:Pentatricopeptide repeat-containing protein, chloroplastic [Symbiodinium microadriaticum]